MLARSRLEELGFRVLVPEGLFRKDDYLAGDDEARARELMAAFANPEVDAVFPGTGGYGATRILDRLDYDIIRRHPKVFIGFSDITGLHLAIHQKTGLVTFHSPNPVFGLGSPANLSWFSRHWFWRAIRADQYPAEAEATAAGYSISAGDIASATSDRPFAETCQMDRPTALRGGTCRGRLTGGNLSLIAALMGTPFEIDTDDRILFLEDIGEAPYRVDRMLSTLRLAGKFDRVAGVVLGTFTRRKSEDTSQEVKTIDEVLADYFQRLKVPVVRGFPVGHHACNATLPLGVACELNADQAELRLLENPVRLP